MAKKEILNQALKKLEFIEPNANLANGFIKKAEDSLEEMRNAKKRDWKIGTAYYAMYQSVYALFMRVGIKSEVHTHTLALAETIFMEYFNSEDFLLLYTAFEARKDTTYYVNREVSDTIVTEIMTKAPYVFTKCKAVLSKLTERNINELREKILSLKK